MKTPEEIINDAAVLRPGRFSEMPGKTVTEALDAAGYVIRPKKATKEMCEAAYWVEGCIGPFGSKTDAAHVWETMIAAFQTQKGQPPG